MSFFKILIILIFGFLSFSVSNADNHSEVVDKAKEVIKDLENTIDKWSYEKLNETDRISSYIKDKLKDYDFS